MAITAKTMGGLRGLPGGTCWAESKYVKGVSILDDKPESKTYAHATIQWNGITGLLWYNNTCPAEHIDKQLLARLCGGANAHVRLWWILKVPIGARVAITVWRR